MPFLPPNQQRQSTEGIIMHTQTENKIELGLLITDEHKWKKGISETSIPRLE